MFEPFSHGTISALSARFFRTTTNNKNTNVRIPSFATIVAIAVFYSYQFNIICNGAVIGLAPFTCFELLGQRRLN